MKRIDRFNLLDRIGRELQAKMTYSDIDVYLKGFNINTDKKTSSVNSKWVYTKELLSDETDETILRIANELGIEHGFVGPNLQDISESKFWLANHFRLFISHISEHKQKATQLQQALKRFGISSFVAHENIEPTKEWQDEIENALFSMDALVAVLTPKFNESKWTDQEIGVAIGRGVLIIPIRKGLDPYGFIAKYQGLQSEGKTVGEVAESVFQIIMSHSKTSSTMTRALVNQILILNNVNEAEYKLALLGRFKSVPEHYLVKLRDNIASNSKLASSEDFNSNLNSLLVEHGLSTTPSEQQEEMLSEDIPF